MTEWYEIFLWIHAGGFNVAGLAVFVYTLLTTLTMEKRHRTDHIEAGAVTTAALLVTALNYALLVTQLLPNPWVRWAFYTAACPMFAYKSATAIGASKRNAALAGIFMLVTLAGGVFPFFSGDTLARTSLFVTASITYVIALFYMAFDDHFQFIRGSWERAFFAFFVLTWSAYPAVYAFGQGGLELLSTQEESVFYFVLEWLAKYMVAVLIMVLADRKRRQNAPRKELK